VALKHSWLLCALLCAACSPMYVVRAGLEEAKILSRRRPIADVLRDARTDSITRRKLDLVLQARTFSQRQLRLNAGESFTTYSWVEHDTLLMVLSAARKDRFEQYNWWFPIVGHVPYKGYFNFQQAYDAAAELDQEGYDTYVRPSSAFSTLGWFNDPLLNTVLRYGDVGLASTVIHELVHNTLYVPSRVSFNESFANFVGDRGAVEFFCTRNGERDPRCTLARNAWADNLVFGRFLSELIASLEALYARPGVDLPERLRLREEVFTSARSRFVTEVEPQLRTNSFRGFHREPLNNASLIATRLYYDRLDVFEAVYERLGGDLVAATAKIIELAKDSTDDPFGAIQRYLSELR
jgi:predicted aminopeptidase